MEEKKLTFRDFWLADWLVETIEAKWYTHPTPIQEKVLPLLLDGDRDVIGQAQTGSWKTAAFALPILNRLEENNPNVQAIILTPTRELAIQVATEIKSFTQRWKTKVALLYGGQFISKEIKMLRERPQIVVGTPGRVKDHLINRRTLKLQDIKYFILDEADEMLNIWFREDIEEIMRTTPEEKRVLLFSATMPTVIKNIAHKYMVDHLLLKVESEDIDDLIEQKCYKINWKDKFEALCRVIEVEDDFYGIIFCKTKVDVDEVSSNLMTKGYLVEWIHGDIDQSQREKTLNRFKWKKINMLVATDVAARGIDVNDLTHVINYSLPDNPETYTHRIGRTGRAGKTGIAISFISPIDNRKLSFIERIIKKPIKVEKIPSADKIVEGKKKRLIEKIGILTNTANLDDYKTIAEKLLEIGDAETIVAAMIRLYHNDEFKAETYKEIRENKTGASRAPGWKIRLFIAKGRKDDLDKIGVKKFVEETSGVDLKQVRDVDVFDEFSFMNVLPAEADAILRVFKDMNSRKPLVVQAKSSWGWGGWSRGGYNRWGWGWGGYNRWGWSRGGYNRWGWNRWGSGWGYSRGRSRDGYRGK